MAHPVVHVTRRLAPAGTHTRAPGILARGVTGMAKDRPWTGCALAACGALGVAIAAQDPARAQDPVFGAVTVLATVPTPPGYPEGLAVRDGLVYVAGPARTGTLLSGEPSRALVFNGRTGQLAASYAALGEDLLREHANSCVAFDAAGRLYVLNTQLGLYRLNVQSGVQEAYGAPFPDLPACGLGPTPCSPTALDLPALPNDLAFTAGGDAYVTDSFQATIWRVPAGGGAPRIWFQDPRLASAYIGVNGVRVDPGGARLYLTVTADLQARGYVYTLPLVDAPGPADLAVFHAFKPGDAPDGVAFGATGKLYVTLALPTTSGVAVLRPDGSEETRVTNPLLSPTVPFDSPANLAFDGYGSLLVTNHAFATNLPSHFTVLRMYVGDPGAPLEQPALP